jgi:fatty acid desaturase
MLGTSDKVRDTLSRGMAFWILVVGLPATLALAAAGFGVGVRTGIATIAGLVGAWIVVGVVHHYATQPSHLERLVAADATMPGPVLTSCHRMGPGLNRCNLHDSYGTVEVCVTPARGRVRYVPVRRCGIEKTGLSSP